MYNEEGLLRFTTKVTFGCAVTSLIRIILDAILGIANEPEFAHHIHVFSVVYLINFVVFMAAK